MHLTIVLVFLLFNLFFSQNAALEVVGPKSLAEIRDRLPDKAFKMDMKDAIILKSKDFKARFVNVPRNPALTAADVQFNFGDVVIKAGKSFIRHIDPRSAETLFIVKGKLKITFWFEGVNPRVVTNIVGPNEYAIVPQALPHSVSCVSQQDCFFVVIFRSADPGLVPLPLDDSDSD